MTKVIIYSVVFLALSHCAAMANECSAACNARKERACAPGSGNTSACAAAIQENYRCQNACPASPNRSGTVR